MDGLWGGRVSRILVPPQARLSTVCSHPRLSTYSWSTPQHKHLITCIYDRRVPKHISMIIIAASIAKCHIFCTEKSLQKSLILVLMLKVQNHSTFWHRYICKIRYILKPWPQHIIVITTRSYISDHRQMTTSQSEYLPPKREEGCLFAVKVKMSQI